MDYFPRGLAVIIVKQAYEVVAQSLAYSGSRFKTDEHNAIDEFDLGDQLIFS